MDEFVPQGFHVIKENVQEIIKHIEELQNMDSTEALLSHLNKMLSSIHSISCGILRALENCDLIEVVTEGSNSGRHDLSSTYKSEFDAGEEHAQEADDETLEANDIVPEDIENQGQESHEQEQTYSFSLEEEVSTEYQIDENDEPKLPDEKPQVKKKEETADFVCSECGSKFRDKRGLRGHKLRKHSEVVFFCEECTFTTSDRSHLRRHKLRLHLQIKLPCDQCGQLYSDRSTLMRHIRNIHGATKVEVCDECGVSAPDSKALQRHKVNVHLRKLVELKCDQCSYVTHYRNKLGRHIQVAHCGVRFPCPHCDYKATDSSHLKRHIENIHKQFKYSCDQCDYQASDPGNLKGHKKRIHSQVFDVCALCDYVATSSVDLKRHTHIMHRSLVLACDQCDYADAEDEAELRQHKSQCHPNLYLCDQCDYKSAQLSNLKRHKRTVHRI